MRYADCSSSGCVIPVCMYVIIPTGSLVWGKLYTYILIPKVRYDCVHVVPPRTNWPTLEQRQKRKRKKSNRSRILPSSSARVLDVSYLYNYTLPYCISPQVWLFLFGAFLRYLGMQCLYGWRYQQLARRQPVLCT